MKKIIFLPVISFFIPLLSMATPNPCTWENEFLLGANDSRFFTLVQVKHLTGTYYYNVDSVFLVEKDHSTGKLLHKQLLRVVEHRDTTSNGNWKHSEVYTNPLNLFQYLASRKVLPVYRDAFPATSFQIRDTGLVMRYRGIDAQIVSKASMSGFIPWLETALEDQTATKGSRDFRIRISGAFSNGATVFLVVDTGPEQSDVDYRQTLLAIPRNTITQAIQRINRQLLNNK